MSGFDTPEHGGTLEVPIMQTIITDRFDADFIARLAEDCDSMEEAEEYAAGDLWLDSDYLFSNGKAIPFVTCEWEDTRYVVTMCDSNELTESEASLLAAFGQNIEWGHVKQYSDLWEKLTKENWRESCREFSRKQAVIAYRGGSGYTYSFHTAH